MNEIFTNIINYAICAISVIITIITTVVTKVKSKKKQDEAKTMVDKKVGEIEETKSRFNSTQDLLTIFTEILPASVIMAEKAGIGINGATKKLLAISDIIQKCSVKGISYTDYANQIDAQLEAELDLTKQVNSNRT